MRLSNLAAKAGLTLGAFVLGSGSLSMAAALLPVTGNPAFTGIISGNLVDHQPSATGSSPIGETTAQSGWGGTVSAWWQDGWGWLDFGPNYSQISISAAYCHFNEWTGSGNHNGNGFADYKWTNDTASLPATWTAGPNFGFGAIAPAVVNDSSWFQTWSGAVTPAGRYLMLNGGSDPNKVSDRLAEVAFYGTVPEPASLGIISVVALLTLRRRR